jgi:hypothetical protein
MSRNIPYEIEFACDYEVAPLERIDRSIGRAYSFPDGLPVDPQQQHADRPIVAVRPRVGDPWVGVFYGGSYLSGDAVSGRLIAWPDGHSLCVVYAGGAVVVRADNPKSTYEIAASPVITDMRVVPELELVLFADWTNLHAYGADGPVWHSRRLALDELKIDDVEAETIHVSGFFGGSYDAFTVNARTGEASGQPYDPSQ